MKTLHTLLALIMPIVLFSQNGINYKALIKDNSGNIIADNVIQVKFKILESDLQTSLYEESHTTTTDSNGIIVLNIGEGTVLNGNFNTINWGENEHFLNVKIDLGTEFIDMGSTQFSAVPYAYHAKKATNVSGLESIDEGNGIGWRLIGRDPTMHSTLGFNAIDLSYSNFSPINNGEMGSYSTTIGYGTAAESYASTAIGSFNVGGGDPNTWVDNSPLFEIGNGTSDLNRRNALTVLKTGEHIINSQSNGLRITGANNAINISNSLANSINITDAGFTGIYIADPQNYGLYISNALNDGVFASSLDRGASFIGGTTGIYTQSSNSNNPDIVLGGNSGTNSEDDGIIASDPFYSGSDIYLRSNDAVVIQLDHDDNGAGNFMVHNSDGNIVFSITEAGTISQNGSTIHASDRRLKRDITDLPYGLKEILQLQPKAYFWKKNTQNKKSLGLIAQDVQPIINEVVNTQNNELKTLGINYTELIPVLIKAIQEQQKIIINQHADYTNLLERVETLEANTSIKNK
ncbi:MULTISPECIES: tail fiber domain-containing protein [unclassified Winogradskyella]|uniref:tail fiber domain-containing protein n=1 Tax=unclassified Winogradskyella TaxID=2615021 RepID=UPI002FF3FD50